MQAIIPDTLNGAIILSVIDFFLSFLIIAGIGFVLALFPLMNRAVKLAAQAQDQPTVSPMSEQVDMEADDHVAVIAAAVYAMLGTHRIVRIEPTHRGTEWAAEGRLALHTSHAVSHHPRH